MVTSSSRPWQRKSDLSFWYLEATSHKFVPIRKAFGFLHIHSLKVLWWHCSYAFQHRHQHVLIMEVALEVWSHASLWRHSFKYVCFILPISHFPMRTSFWKTLKYSYPTKPRSSMLVWWFQIELDYFLISTTFLSRNTIPGL